MWKFLTSDFNRMCVKVYRTYGVAETRFCYESVWLKTGMLLVHLVKASHVSV